jgi:hypothetical protein
MIDDSIKLKLIDLIEVNVIGSLIANSYVTHLGGSLTWDRIVVRDETIELLNSIENKPEINAEKLIDALMEVFPKEQLDSKKALLQRWNQFIKKTNIPDITYNEVIEAAQKHVDDMGSKYCGNLFYFFFKEDKKIYQSRLEKTVLLIRDSDKYTKKIETSMNIDWDNVKVI